MLLAGAVLAVDFPRFSIFPRLFRLLFRPALRAAGRAGTRHWRRGDAATWRQRIAAALGETGAAAAVRTDRQSSPEAPTPHFFGFFWIACAWSAARLAMRVYESEADYSPMAREAAAATSQLLTLARDRFRSCRPALQLSKLQGIQSQSQSKVQLGFTSRHRASAHESHHHAWRHSGKSHASLRMSLVLLARPARHGGTAIACDVLRFIPRDLMRCGCQVCGSG